MKFEKIVTQNRVIFGNVCLELRDARISRYWTNIRTIRSYIRSHICIWQEQRQEFATKDWQWISIGTDWYDKSIIQEEQVSVPRQNVSKEESRIFVFVSHPYTLSNCACLSINNNFSVTSRFKGVLLLARTIKKRLAIFRRWITRRFLKTRFYECTPPPFSFATFLPWKTTGREIKQRKREREGGRRGGFCAELFWPRGNTGGRPVPWAR